MSELNSNLDKASEGQDYTQAENQAAAAVPPTPSEGQVASPAAAPTPSPFANVDGQKLLVLLKNPLESLKLQPATDWIYAAISSAVGVIGFFFFVWALREQTRTSTTNDLDGLFSGLANLARTVYSPFYGVFGFASPGKMFLISIISIALIVGALTLVGNWIGGRKRSWLETATYLGGTQLLFGAGFIIAGIVAFISFELATVLGIAIIALSLIVLVLQALELHEISASRRFPFLYQSVGGYMIAMYIVYLIFT